MNVGQLASNAVRGARLVGGFVTGRPVHCIVQVSNRCNLTCSFCAFWENPAKREHELTTADFETISSRLSEGGSMIVSIEGGEPLMRPDIVEIVRAFARHHHPILFTNGLLATEERARALWGAGLDTAGVSIDYATPEKHDAHRGRAGTHEAARRAIDTLVETAPRGARQVFVMTVLMEDNVDEMEALLELSAAHGVGHQITLLSTDGDGRHDGAKRRPAPGAGARMLELKRRYPHFIAFTGYLEKIDPFLSGSPPARCHAGERFLNVDHLGWVSPCIEKLERRAGNLVTEPWTVVYDRLRATDGIATCGDCLTSCRGFVDEMSGAPKLRSWREFVGDFAKAPSADAATAAPRRLQKQVDAQLARAFGALDLEETRRTYLEQGEFIFLPELLPRDLVEKMQAEADGARVIRSVVPFIRKAGHVGYRELRRRAPVMTAIYRSQAFVDFMTRLAGAPMKLKLDEDDHACALYAYTKKGDGMRFHYDTCGCEEGASYSMILGVVDDSSQRLMVELGKKDPAIAPKKLSLKVTPGSMAIFCGSKVWHGVSPLGANERRVVLSLSYATNPHMPPLRRLGENVKDMLLYFGPGALLQRNYWSKR